MYLYIYISSCLQFYIFGYFKKCILVYLLIQSYQYIAFPKILVQHNSFNFNSCIPHYSKSNLNKKALHFFICFTQACKNKTKTLILKIIVERFRLIFLNSQLFQIEFPSLDKLLLVFGDINSYNYFKKAFTYKKYIRFMKYLYSYLIFVVWELYKWVNLVVRINSSKYCLGRCLAETKKVWSHTRSHKLS